MGMRKGQSAMEYLMTYGWAIIIVIIVAAALYALGVFNPGAYTTTAATGFAELGKPAPGAWQVASNGNVVVNMINNQPYTLNITDLTVQNTAGVECDTLRINGRTLTNQATIANGNSFNVTASCSDFISTPGSSYTLKFAFTYDNVDSGLTGFRDSGTITGKVSS